MAALVGITISNLDRTYHLKLVFILICLPPALDLPIASTDTGCYYHGILKLSAIFWIPGLIYEPILFLLVAYKAWPLKKAERDGPRIPLITRMARDRYGPTVDSLIYGYWA